jgi:uncharacterized lipoprotein YbaY
MSKHGQHLTGAVSKDQRIAPPGDAITEVRYQDLSLRSSPARD